MFLLRFSDILPPIDQISLRLTQKTGPLSLTLGLSAQKTAAAGPLLFPDWSPVCPFPETRAILLSLVLHFLIHS